MKTLLPNMSLGFRIMGLGLKNVAKATLRNFLLFLFTAITLGSIIITLVYVWSVATSSEKIINDPYLSVLGPIGIIIFILLILGRIYLAGEAAHERTKAIAGEGRLTKFDANSAQYILQRHYGGIFKRIDENRELLELIQEKAPVFFKENSWVEGWLQSQDGFLNDLAKFVPADAELLRFKAQEANSRHEGSPSYPRPWPGKSNRMIVIEDCPEIPAV